MSVQKNSARGRLAKTLRLARAHCLKVRRRIAANGWADLAGLRPQYAPVYLSRGSPTMTKRRRI